MTDAELTEIVDLIRAKSRAGELTGLADLQAAIPGIPPSGELDPLQEPSSIHEQILTHNDLKTLPDDAGNPFYYSARFMADAYASALLLKREGPLRMMAEIIREHSRIYPRPVPIALFQCNPFNLTEDQIAAALKEMMQKPPYRDIAQTTTSIGNVFAYSTDYLSRDYAAMLAEWADVGQAENP